MDPMDIDTWFRLDYALKHDEECAAYKKIKRRARFLFACFLCASILLFVIGQLFIAAVTSVLTVSLLVAVILQNKYKPKQYLPFVYGEGNPTPAILSQTEPLVLYALADIKQGEAEPVYGLCRFRVASLPGHAIEPGERVPCAAMYEESKERPPQFLYYRLHPYCWATETTEHLKAWIDAIPEFEWELLQKSMTAYADIEDGKIIELRTDNSFLMTALNSPSEFIERLAQAQLSLQPEEIPLIVCANGMILTSFGVWYKDTFHTWETGEIKVRHSSLGKLDISICGQHAAIIPYKKQYYANPITDDEFHALEIKHMTDFLQGLSTLRADHV